jgi:hypothetical protein
MLRHSRNVISVLCAIAPLVLIPMWVRSYHFGDEFCAGLLGRRSLLLASKEGRVTTAFIGPSTIDSKRWTATTRSLDVGASFPIGHVSDYESALGFGWITHPDYVLDVDGPLGTMVSLVPAGTPSRLATLSFTDAQGHVVPGTSSWASQTFDGYATVTSRAAGSNSTAQAQVVPRLNAAGPIIPYWFLVLLPGVGFALARLRRPWRFSLRALLAATTYIAVVLALVTALDR